MKPLQQIPGFLLGAALAGILGFAIGKNQNPADGTTRAPSEIPGHAARSSRPAVRDFDAGGFRRKLEEEKDPLKRQQLAQSDMERWVAQDPAGALAWMKAQPKSGRLEEMISLALDQYAETDPKGALEWASKNMSGRDLHNEMILLSEKWAESDPAAAAQWIADQPSSQARDAAIEGVIFSWGGASPQDAIAFLAKFSDDPELRAALTNAAYAGWAKSDPLPAAAASLEASRAAGNPKPFAITIANWATVDLGTSSAWLLGQPAGAERSAAVNQLAGIFAQVSPESASAWLGKLQPEERAAATNEFGANYSRVDPQGAAAWAAKQPEGSLGQEALEDIVRSFSADDAAAFEAWKNQLPPGALKTSAEANGRKRSAAPGGDAPPSGGPGQGKR